MSNIYAKLAEARKQFHSLKLKKSGKNKFAGYSYFELSDFIIPGMDCLRDHGLVPVVSFGIDVATMTLHSTEDDSTIVVHCPNSEAHLKGCHPIQNAGAVQTYQRRYLWMAALEIVEHDAVDAAEPRKAPAKDESGPATPEQKAKIKELAKEKKLSPRRMSWLKNNAKTITFNQAGTILKEAAEQELQE